MSDFPACITVAFEDQLDQCEYIRIDLAEQRVDALKQRMRELEVLLREAHGILTEAKLDKEHSVWMEQVDKTLRRESV